MGENGQFFLDLGMFLLAYAAIRLAKESDTTINILIEFLEVFARVQSKQAIVEDLNKPYSKIVEQAKENIRYLDIALNIALCALVFGFLLKYFSLEDFIYYIARKLFQMN